MITTTIPIQNYYYLLSYAWNLFKETEQLRVNTEDCDNLQDLFARVLISGAELLIKKGIKKKYIDTTEHVRSLKGKINLKNSVTDLIRQNGKLCCEYDELTFNILENQIIFSTLKMLMSEDIDKGLKSKIKFILSYPDESSYISLRKDHFVRAKHQNKHGIYALLINICEIIFLSKIPSPGEGQSIFKDFINGERELSKLFEMFTFNFYRRKLGNDFEIDFQTHIPWGLKPLDLVSKKFLPSMRSDVIIKNKDIKIIIDTKFYKQTFQMYFDKESIHSSNLYQLQSYVLNDRMTGFDIKRIGILLYPSIAPSEDLNYEFDSSTLLKIRIIDLSQSWHEIEKRMLGFILS